MSTKSSEPTRVVQPAGRTNRNALLFGISKPLMIAVGGYALLATGGAGYFFSQFMKIPGLDNQIEDLEAEVDRLEVQIGSLETQVDRLGVEVEQLGTEVTRLEDANAEAEELIALFESANGNFTGLVQELQENNEALIENNQSLNASNTVLEMSVQNLTTINDGFAGLIESQGEAVSNLTTQVEQLEATTTSLNATVQALEVQVADFNNTAQELAATNANLTTQVNDFEMQVSTISEENAGLQETNRQLESLLGFFNESLTEQTFDAALAELSSQIETNQNLWMLNLEQTYQQRARNWKCNLYDVFAGYPFVVDLNAPLGDDSTELLGFLQDELLDELCLDSQNMMDYLQAEANLPLEEQSLTQVEQGVSRYTDLALEHYFDSGAVPVQSWLAASSDCQDLAEGEEFRV